MKRIINYSKKQLARSKEWIKNTFTLCKRFGIKHLTINAFRIVLWSKKHAQENFDKNIVEFYRAVRTKQAFPFKCKIMNAGKGQKHFKILLIETPQGVIEVDILPIGHEDYNKYDELIAPKDGQ